MGSGAPANSDPTTRPNNDLRLCIAMSSTSYYFLEQPARNFDTIETRTVVIACLVSLIALAVIGVMLTNVNCVEA
ncbi:unnamed protein product [Sphagnum balticum]